MKNIIYINDINVETNRIIYNYSIEGTWAKYFKTDVKFYVEYSDEISMVPKSIAVVPLLCNILPIAWVCDAEIRLKELDEDFYKSINDFKKGYIDMYPKISFDGKLSINNIVNNTYIPENKMGCPQTAMFFSGGVDSFATLLAHIEEKPALITLWGSDITFDDTEGWLNVKEHVLNTAVDFQLKHLFIKSCFHMFLYEGELTKRINKKSGEGWWHGFQHGIGLIGHVAPYAYKNKIKTIYIASTLTEKDKGIATCASSPIIDNYVKFGSCSVCHDQYECTRQDKIHNICAYSKIRDKSLNLRVCWESKGGKNCCKCEKCYRTILGILAEKADPNDFGFVYNDKIQNKLEFDMKYIIKLENDKIVYWKDIQNTFRNNKEYFNTNSKYYKWIMNFDIEHQSYFLRKMYKIANKMKKFTNLKKKAQK